MFNKREAIATRLAHIEGAVAACLPTPTTPEARAQWMLGYAQEQLTVARQAERTATLLVDQLSEQLQAAKNHWRATINELHTCQGALDRLAVPGDR